MRGTKDGVMGKWPKEVNCTSDAPTEDLGLYNNIFELLRVQ